LSCFSGIAQENLEIKKIRIKGEKVLNKRSIKDNLSLQTTSWFKQKVRKKEPVLFTTKQYTEDIKRLIKQYQKEGFMNVAFDEPKITINNNQTINLTILPFEISQLISAFFDVVSTESL